VLYDQREVMSTDAPLKVDPDQLPADVGVLKSLVVQLVETLHERDRRIAKLEHHMDLLVRKVYGRTSEKLDPQQLPLFEKQGADDGEPAVVDQPAAETPSTSSAKRGRGRRKKPDTLERRDVVHDLNEAEKQALAAGGQLVLIGEEVTEQYEWEPSCLYVLRHVQKKYVCRPALTKDGQPAERQIITAAKPPQPIPGSSAGPGLLAYLLTSRFCDHLPYHRQERIFGRHGLRFSRQTTCDWARQLAELCEPLYRLMIDEVLASDVLHSDDTPVKVRDAHQKRQYLGRFWNYIGDEEHPLTVFAYTPDRARDGPAEFLKHYRGYLQADAYGGYDRIFTGSRGAIVEVACWAHARRNFFEARSSDALRAQTALAFIGQLYKIERALAERTQTEWRELPRPERAAKIAQQRQEQARPVLQQFAAWLDAEAPRLLPKEPIRQAIEYARNQWAALNRYCDDGRLAIDNNAAERALRGIAVGRRNWLFCGSDRGGQTAAVHFSLVASCLRHGLDPFSYLRDVFTRLPVLLAGVPTSADLRRLLPDLWSVQ
jgi:transposase